MSHDPKAASEIVAPLSGEIEEAKRIPGGWVYRIAGKFGSNHGIPSTTDLMLHRIANQWGYNLASRSMDLQAVAFPALVAADEGWVQYLSEAAELSCAQQSATKNTTGDVSFSTIATIL